MLLIPRVFHTVWLHTWDISAKRLHRIQTWKSLHPEWEHRLWTPEALQSSGIAFTPEHRGMDGDGSLALKSRILGRFGGIILNIDLECLENIEPLLEDLEVFLTYDTSGHLGDLIMGGTSGHALFETLAEPVEAAPSFTKHLEWEDTGILEQTVSNFLNGNTTGLQLADEESGTVVAEVYADTLGIFSPWVFQGEPKAAVESSNVCKSFARHHWLDSWYERVGWTGAKNLHAVVKDGDGEGKREGSARLAIVIPTINRADLLRESMQVILEQLEFVERVFIIDNGKQNIVFNSDRITVLEQDSNIGVAASWNLGIHHALRIPAVSHVLVLNDDIVLGPDQIQSILKVIHLNLNKWMFVGPYYWSVWVLAREGAIAMGIESGKIFDEDFYPAYFEDNDFYYRFHWLCPGRYMGEMEELKPEVQRNSMSLAKDPSLSTRFLANQRYYVNKWGGAPGNERLPVGSSLSEDAGFPQYHNAG